MKKNGPTTAFEIVKTVGLALPEVEAMTNWTGLPVLRVRGCFMAGLASHRSVEPSTLVVRCALDDRERLLEDAPDTYYVTDYYRPYPVVLVRLSHLESRRAPRPALCFVAYGRGEGAEAHATRRSLESGPVA